MFKKLISRDLPAAKAYHAAKLNSFGNDAYAASLLADSTHRTRDEINAAIDRYVVAVRAQLEASPADQRGVSAGRMATSAR